ncbi:MAG: DUF3868 domain-containing protein [Alistipes sp.]|nr:DUF3868 domain-containing protein [Alistipes sp.]
MKKILILIAALTIVASGTAQQRPHHSNFEGARISDVELSHRGDTLHIALRVELGGRDIRTNQATIYTPVLFNGDNELLLPSVGVYGHNHYITMLRDEEHRHSVPLDWQLRHKDLPADVAYETDVEYMPWMNGAELALVEQLYGCHNKLIGIADIILGEYSEPIIVPSYIFVIPEVEQSGTTHYTRTAQLDFPQNVAVIEAGFDKNSEAIATINTLFEDMKESRDATIKHLWVRASASPEGGKEFNEELVHKRAAALINHIRTIVNIPDVAITTEYNTDNWTTVHEWVTKSKLTHREAIAKLIETKMTSEHLNEMIMERYPKEYHTMFEQLYPTLRYAEFRLDYDIKNYREVERIIAIARVEPESLNDEELNTAAANLDQSSPEFENVVMAIVAKHPNDATANLNAGNVKMRRGELHHAEHYLKRAGTSAEADYARALLAIHNGNYTEAKRLLTKVEKRITEASTLLEKLNEAGM